MQERDISKEKDARRSNSPRKSTYDKPTSEATTAITGLNNNMDLRGLQSNQNFSGMGQTDVVDQIGMA